LPRLFLAQLEFKDRPEGSEAASEEGMRIAKTRRKHSRSYVLADYFRIGRNIIRKGDKVIQIVEQPDGRRLIDAPADVLYTRPWQGKGWGGQALASRDTAALNLNRTEVRASVNGFITNLNLATGTFASQRKPVMALIDSDSYRVEAYFEETKIPHIKPGATAKIRLMDGSPALLGTVVGIARGITDQDNKDGPELLSSINPTFTWVRLAQRIPVGIHLTHVPPGVFISAGMTCTVVMKEGAGSHIAVSIKKAAMAIFWSTFELVRWRAQ
jgi:hypothetical protein